MAFKNSRDLENAVAETARGIGLEAAQQVTFGRRIWGSGRRIDVLITHPESSLRLGVECKLQTTSGTAQEKIPATLEDIRAWPIRGIVVFAGDGFSDDFKAFIRSSGQAIEFDEFEVWLRLFFGLPLS